MDRSRQITTKIPRPEATIISELPMLAISKHFRGQVYSRRIWGFFEAAGAHVRQNCPTRVARLPHNALQ
jgi:hypothetical protein